MDRTSQTLTITFHIHLKNSKYETVSHHHHHQTPSTTMSPPVFQSLSFSSQITPDPTRLFLSSTLANLSIANPPPSTTIRMGGGPRTFPGGVTKWQWKRMQAKKAKQLLRARLARERQIYEMRKRAELNAAVSELERPWEIVEKAPKLFSTSADEQVKFLADRFQKPGGFDLWSEKDGPQLFETVEGIPSARFFPKGVVHSVKPYGRITDGNSDREIHDSGIGYKLPGQDLGLVMRNENEESLNKDCKRRIHTNSIENRLNQRESGIDWRKDSNKGNEYDENSRNENGEWIKKDGRRRIGTISGGNGNGLKQRQSGSNWRKDSKRGIGRKEESGLDSEVFDMNLQDDGSYGVSKIKRRTDRK